MKTLKSIKIEFNADGTINGAPTITFYDSYLNPYAQYFIKDIPRGKLRDELMFFLSNLPKLSRILCNEFKNDDFRKLKEEELKLKSK